MDAILVSADPKTVDVEDVIEHLRDHKELYWPVGFRIRSSVIDSLRFPILCFIHIKGREVEYKAVVEKIIPFSPEHYDNRSWAARVKPKSFQQAWRNDHRNMIKRWKTELVITRIEPFLFNTRSFKVDNTGEFIKRPPVKYARVIPPSDAPDIVPDNGNNKQLDRRPDEGPDVKYTRDGHSADPQHAKIVKALEEALTKDGWKFNHKLKCNPDILATKHRGRVLFEIKPDISNASFYMGLGQLLLYRRYVGKCQSFLVVPDESVSEDRLSEWRTEFKERAIGFVTYKTRGEQYYFPKLAIQLRA